MSQVLQIKDILEYNYNYLNKDKNVTMNDVIGNDSLTPKDGNQTQENTLTTTSNKNYKSILTKIYQFFQSKTTIQINELLIKRQLTNSFQDWYNIALQLDILTNKQQWKAKLSSTLYDYNLINNITQSLKNLRLDGNFDELIYMIRTNWVRNLGNMGNVNLYRHSYIGTKHNIDNYLQESRDCIDFLLQNCDSNDENYLLGVLQQTRKNIGRTALVLSGGGTFGLFHIGVLATLFEMDLLPRVISGSSAGAIVAAILTTHYKEEIPDLINKILKMDFNIFKDDSQKSESENFLIKFSRFFKDGTWFNNKHLINTMIEFLGDLTFREAYNRTGKILNITVSPASYFEQPRLLNNLTAPNVLIWSAVCASCSLPGIFPSSPLFEKDPITNEMREWNGSSSVKFVDGSVDNDLPISRLSEMFNVDHIIACQVNIHVVPFLKLSVSCVGGEIEDEFSARLRQQLGKLYNFCSNEIIHLLEMGSEIGIARNTLTKFRSVLSQQYSGDITILPDMKMLLRINKLLTNPTHEFLLNEISNGIRATWPKIPIIENHCGQEFALDKAISQLRGKIVMSSYIKNPLQFDMTLIKNNRSNALQLEKDKKKLENDTEYQSNVLDDNLLETESTSSLYLLSKNKNKNPNSGDKAVNNEFMNNIMNKYSLKLHSSPNTRRKSDTGMRPQNLRSTLHSSPHSKQQRNSLFSKKSTGHIMLERKKSKSLIRRPKSNTFDQRISSMRINNFNNINNFRDPFPRRNSADSNHANMWSNI